ncbi:MAG TPA: D-alanine--D-alanine ligase [bacterium]|nr:D-alanine--D-alanine ligase [bacterium]
MRTKIGVLYGGGSSEREVSLRSGTAILNALQTKGHDAVGIDVSEKTVETQLRTAGVTVAFIALHGRFGEDGRIQRVCEKLGIPYTGSGVAASEIAIDKIKTKEVLVRNGIPTPRSESLGKGAGKARTLPAAFPCPMVIKPALEGSSIGLSIIDRRDQLDEALERAFSYDNEVLVEEFVKGRELTVGILGGQALPVIQVVPKNAFYDYQAKYTKGMTEYIVPAQIDGGSARRAQSLALRTHQAIGCRDLSRVDMILTDAGDVFVLEINTIPGFTETSLLPKAARAAGIGFEDLCDRILAMACEREPAAAGGKNDSYTRGSNV